MQELEKILEEIEAEHPYKIPGDCDSYSQYNEAWQDAIDRVRGRLEIFFKERTNDGWIPVERRLPDNNEDVLVTTDVGLITFGYVSHGKWITDQEPDYPIAWRPLPEPYHPERSE